jgi:hypothetical protein
MHVCVCVCARACVGVGEVMWMHACMCEGVGMDVRTCDFARVALIIQHAKRTRHFVCGLSGFIILFDIRS